MQVSPGLRSRRASDAAVSDRPRKTLSGRATPWGGGQHLSSRKLHNRDVDWGYYSCPSLWGIQIAYLREFVISAQPPELVSTRPDLKTLQ
jgi:hypothetical protein